ncbi:MAG: hypothetical protein AABZ06_04310, partial [Bdellovibrionota bacterium]
SSRCSNPRFVRPNYATTPQKSHLGFFGNIGLSKYDGLHWRLPEQEAILGRKDHLLNSLYKQIKGTKSDADFKPIMASQRMWIKDRNTCKDAGCLSPKYIQRIAELKESLKSTASAPKASYSDPLLGEWTVIDKGYDCISSSFVAPGVALELFLYPKNS